MVENDQKYQYWMQGALEDLEVAKILAEKGKIRHSLYFAHLVLIWLVVIPMSFVARTDSRIEPVHCGENEWKRKKNRMIMEIARQEGEILRPQEDSTDNG